jgi:hypothetical protein
MSEVPIAECGEAGSQAAADLHISHLRTSNIPSLNVLVNHPAMFSFHSRPKFPTRMSLKLTPVLYRLRKHSVRAGRKAIGSC